MAQGSEPLTTLSERNLRTLVEAFKGKFTLLKALRFLDSWRSPLLCFVYHNAPLIINVIQVCTAGRPVWYLHCFTPDPH